MSAANANAGPPDVKPDPVPAQPSEETLKSIYIAAQTHYLNPAFKLLSSEQWRYYVGLNDPVVRSVSERQPAMYALLTSRDTQPSYIDTIMLTHKNTLQMNQPGVNEVHKQQLVAEIQSAVESSIHLPELARKKAADKQKEQAARAEAERHRNAGLGRNEVEKDEDAGVGVESVCLFSSGARAQNK